MKTLNDSASNSDLTNVFVRQSFLHRMRFRLYLIILKIIFKNCQSLYLKIGDWITVSFLANKGHEDLQIATILRFSEGEEKDFFLDVGANVGLVSVPVAAHFKRVVCVEPNPVCRSILKANLAEAGVVNFDLVPVALGLDTNCAVSLMIPKGNVGGAFLATDDNRYSKQTLADKDGFLDFDKGNYDEVRVPVMGGDEFFQRFFSDYNDNHSFFGCIKIDVEGYDILILEKLAKNCPPQFRGIILFENWDKSISANMIVEMFKHLQTSIYCLKKSRLFDVKTFWEPIIDSPVYGECLIVVEQR